MTPTTIGPMIVLRISSIMDYLTSFRRRCRSAEQYYIIKYSTLSVGQSDFIFGKEAVIDYLLLLPVIFLVVGGFLILLWRLFLIASGLFLIGFVSCLIFVEGYGIYLLFTETELYTKDLAQNGLFGFTTFFIIFNLVLLVLVSLAGYKWKRGY